jgi:hypothetical protein
MPEIGRKTCFVIGGRLCWRGLFRQAELEQKQKEKRESRGLSGKLTGTCLREVLGSIGKH